MGRKVDIRMDRTGAWLLKIGMNGNLDPGLLNRHHTTHHLSNIMNFGLYIGGSERKAFT